MSDREFTIAEIEQAAALPSRSIEILKRDNLAPKPMNAGGKGRATKYSFASLSRLVAIGEIAKTVGGVVPAARIANGILPELEAIHGTLPFGMKDISRGLSGVEGIWHEGELVEFAVFREGFRRGLVEPGRPMDNDYKLLIVDGEYVLQAAATWGHQPSPKGENIHIEKDQVWPLLTYRLGEGRGGGIVVESADRDSEETERYYIKRLNNAANVVRLNLSLSLRRALSRILEAREAVDGI